MIKSSDLTWIVVSDIKKSRKFFTETLGLKEHTYSEEHGWVELKGQDGGSWLGVGQADPEMAPGSNGVVTFTVDNLDKTIAEFKKKNVKLIGEPLEIPGHVRMQMFTDLDGNKFQIVETLSPKKN